MPKYLVRVELFHAKGDDYSALHEGMASLGLDRTATFDDGKKYKLPTGTYLGENASSQVQLRDKVCKAANPHSPHKDAAVFVCQADGWSAWLYAD